MTDNSLPNSCPIEKDNVINTSIVLDSLRKKLDITFEVVNLLTMGKLEHSELKYILRQLARLLRMACVQSYQLEANEATQSH